MKPHLLLSHHYFEQIVKPCDIVIDATCGNGHDTSKLASLAEKVYAIDIQDAAIKAMKEKLKEFDNVIAVQSCHSQFPKEISKSSIKLIVYNLGYLPGGNKSITTKIATTLESVRNAMGLIMPTGWISIMCYPGHEEGYEEEKALLEFTEQLDYRAWSVCHHRFVNRKLSPSLLMIQRY